MIVEFILAFIPVLLSSALATAVSTYFIEIIAWLLI